MTTSSSDPGPARPAAPGGGEGGRGRSGPAIEDEGALLRLITETASDVIFRTRLGDPPVVEYLSPAAFGLTGYRPEEFYRDPELNLRLFHPDDRHLARDVTNATREGLVVRWIRRDGRVIHVETRARLVRDESGRPVAVEGIVRDVSERIRAQEALRESEARLRSVFAAMDEGVLLFDEQGRIVYGNPSAERVLGRPLAQLLGHGSGEEWKALREDGTALPVEEYPVNRTLRTGEPTRNVLLGIRRPDGTVGWVSTSSEPVRLAGGMRGVLVSFSDTTAERRAWVEVRRREAQLRLAMECAGHDFWELDVARWDLTRGGTILLSELPRPTDVGAWHALVHPEDLDRDLAVLEAHIAGRTPVYESEVRLRADDGEWRWMLHKGRAVARDASGRATRVAGTMTDITEIKRLQERLREADRLAGVGTLAAAVAHEINNPLSYVTANLTVIEESLARTGAAGTDGPAASAGIRELRQALHDAMDGAARVRGIVQGLRQFARPSRGEERGPVNLKAEIDAAVGIARNEIAHRARLQIDVPDQLPPVRAAPHELGQLLVNLLVNAAQAIPEGHAQENEIRIAGSLQGERVVVEVRDTGVGIPPADLQRIFDPFYTTKEGRTGTGLGLSVCRSIVTSLGGTIDVESAPGQGATFRVTLPVLAGGATPAPAPAAPAVVRRGRVLVVDDEALVAKSLARLLSAHDVTVVTSASEVLKRAAAGERWDVVLCDLMMPEMTGMELEERLAADAPDLVPRIVYLTGGAFTERSRAFLAQGRPHLEKPVEPAVLRARVAERVAAVLGK